MSEREPLHLKYRPAVFADVAGQRPVMVLLYLMCKRGTVPPAMLFSGESGCGKTTMARIVAKALNCESGPGKASEWPCNKCPTCKAVDTDTCPDVEEIDAASNGTVDQIRDIRRRAYYGTAGGRWRVVIVDEAHGVSGAGFEAFLKIVEEPPPRTVFIFITTQPDSIPDTILGRLSPFEFRPLTVPVIREQLDRISQAEGFNAEPELLTAIAEAARGRMRNSQVLLDQMAAADITSLNMWRELTGETDFAPALLTAAADGNYAAMYATAGEALSSSGDPRHVTRELTACLADLLVLSCGVDIGAQGEALEARRALSSRLGVARIQGAMSVLWDVLTKAKLEDREMVLTLALSKISRVLCPPPSDAPIARDDKASFGEIQSILGRA